MYPQAELENYKLQVQLLQEKLQRSEDNRQQLEHKLDKVLQKRSELEKGMRHKSRQKYQEFLEEQTKRNERNKKLVQMLERIDEQTEAMSQRSERLKMMKLQYQMYFSKLVQNQTMRCIQQTTTPGASTLPIPVLLQQQTAAGGQASPMPATAQHPNQSQPVLSAAPQQWTFAMATPTPTPAGMMLAPHFAPQPVYMPVPDLYGGVGGASVSGGQAFGTSNLFDLRATLRALDNENAELPERMTHFDAAGLAATQYPKDSSDRSTTGATSSMTANPCTEKEKSPRGLSSTSSTLATSLLTFDKLPKTATLTELPTAAVTGIDDVGGRPQTAAQLREPSQHGLEPRAWQGPHVAEVEHEISPTVVGHNEPGQQQQRQPHHSFDAYFGELKIDEPWQPAGTTRARNQREDKLEQNVRVGEMTAIGGGGAIGGINNDLLDEVKASRAAVQKAAAAVDEHLARSNQLSPTAASEQSAKPTVSIENIENAIYGERLTASAAAATSAATRAAATAATAAATAAAASPAQGLLDNLGGNPPQRHPEQQDGEQVNAMAMEPLPEQQQQQTTHDEAQIDYGQYDANSYGDPGEPSYASIDSGHQQQQLPQQPSTAVEPIYSEIGNPTDYQQYATDASAMPEGEIDTAAAQAQGEYSNMDYNNYDAGQYTAAGYDPNAYPGYIYDEATGQYIADPNAVQYAADGSYAGQEYDAGATNYDYYGEQQQQQQEPQQEQQEAAYPMSDNTSEAAELMPLQEAEQSPSTDAADANAEATHSPAASKPVRPPSILASTDKQAAPNDAQQQQQQQLKKKKRVNFVDSSETDDSSSAKPVQDAPTNPTATPPTPAVLPTGGAASESDFDFSTGSEAKN